MIRMNLRRLLMKMILLEYGSLSAQVIRFFILMINRIQAYGPLIRTILNAFTMTVCVISTAIVILKVSPLSRMNLQTLFQSQICPGSIFCRFIWSLRRNILLQSSHLENTHQKEMTFHYHLISACITQFVMVIIFTSSLKD